MAITRNKGKRLNQYVPDYIVFDLETTGISVQHPILFMMPHGACWEQNRATII